jgi:hypothetical protein
MRRFSSDAKVECAVPEAKLDDADSSPSIQEKFDEVSCGREGASSEEAPSDLAAGGFVIGVGAGGEEARGLRGADLLMLVAVDADWEGVGCVVGGALDVRSDDRGLGTARVAAAVAVAACSVVSSTGRGIVESSR